MDRQNVTSHNSLESAPPHLNPGGEIRLLKFFAYWLCC